MSNFIVKMLLANKYWAFGISSTVLIISSYLMWNTPIDKVFLNCMYITLALWSAPFAGWNFARISEVD